MSECPYNNPRWQEASAELRERAANVIKLIDGGCSPMDLADDINFLNGIAFTGDYRVREQESENGLPAIVDALDFTSAELNPPVEVVEGILHQGCKMALGGGSKTFKSWALLDLAISVSLGVPWLGFPTSRAKVCFINLELSDWSIYKRLRSIAKARGITLERGQFRVWNLRGHATGYKELLPILAAELAKGGFGLLILDPIYKLYGDSDENSARDISAMLNQFERLAKDTGAAIAFAAHFSKGNQASKEAIDRISGSGCFARDPDAILTLTRHEEENAFTVDSTLRNHASVEPFAVRWKFPVLSRDDELDPAKIKQPNRGGRAQSFTVAMLVECLGDKKLSSERLQKLCMSENRISRPTFYRLFKEAKQAGQIAETGKGKWSVSKVSKPTSDTYDTSKSHNPLGYETNETGKKTSLKTRKAKCKT
jgi:hypothetical protein